MNKSIHRFGRIVSVVMVFLFVIGAALAWAECPNDDEFTQDFSFGDCTFVNNDSEGGNPYFSLHPGHQLVLEGEEDGEEIFVVVTVTEELQTIEFEYNGETIKLKARVVKEDEYIDGELVEESFNYFSRCKETNAVYYFGEWVINYEDEGTNNDGSWIAGANDALPGLIMPGTFLLGSRYFQEIAEEDEAVDRGENTAMGLEEEVIAGEFEGCVEVVDTNPAENVCKTKDGDVKIYCPGIGLVVDEEIELTCYGNNCPTAP
jgi:hypothetical protein